METVIIKAPMGKIEFTSDRTHGGEGNIETLAQSIKALGIIHPPAAKELADNKGHYRIIAGRRRCAAAKLLGWKSIEIIVHPAKADEEAIALAENVNREEMHPLDEAERFRREMDSGKSAEEVARYYARSVSGIHQRVRLTNLVDGIKTMFRDGKMNLFKIFLTLHQI
jgi:ParB family chromosome partitioning protein